jgi:hypothetical protein
LLLCPKSCWSIHKSVYFDAWNPLVLSREELVASPFDSSGIRFGWLRPVIFPFKLSGFSCKKNGVLVRWFSTEVLTSENLNSRSDIGSRSVWPSA